MRFYSISFHFANVVCVCSCVRACVWVGESARACQQAFLSDCFIPLLRASALLRKLFLIFEKIFVMPAKIELFFKHGDFDLLVTTTLGFIPVDKYFLRGARKYNVPICCVCLSWDNTTTKGILTTACIRCTTGRVRIFNSCNGFFHGRFLC